MPACSPSSAFLRPAGHLLPPEEGSWAGAPGDVVPAPAVASAGCLESGLPFARASQCCAPGTVVCRPEQVPRTAPLGNRLPMTTGF